MVIYPETIDGNEALEHAFKYTAHGWFPAKPEAVQTVRIRLSTGYYRNNTAALLTDIKADFSLYLLCLKELRSMLLPLKGSAAPEVDESALRGIRTLIEKRGETLSKHALDKATEFQALRLQDTVLTTAAAEVLSQKLGVERDLAVGAGLLRQLGLTLIAWNYPTLHEEILRHLAGNQRLENDLDSALHNALGFSPAMLGIKFAKSWNVPAPVVDALSLSGRELLSGEQPRARTSPVTSNLAHICAIGEALARASNPQIYPTARDDWERASGVIRRHLGRDGVRLIQQEAHKLSQRYSRYAPLVVERTAAAVSTQPDMPPHAAALFERNIHIKGCTPQVQRRLRGIYAQMKEGQVSSELLRELFHEVLPELGFDKTCVFTVDPATRTLLPLLKVGCPSFIKLRPVAMNAEGESVHPVREAFFSQRPVLESGVLRCGAAKHFAVAPIGERKRVGVVYAEVSTDAPPDTAGHPLAVFKAVVSTVTDLLQLG